MTAHIFWHQGQPHVVWLLSEWMKWNHEVEWCLLFMRVSSLHTFMTTVELNSLLNTCTHKQNTWEGAYTGHHQPHTLYHTTSWKASSLKLAACSHIWTTAQCRPSTSLRAPTSIHPVFSSFYRLNSGISTQNSLDKLNSPSLEQVASGIVNGGYRSQPHHHSISLHRHSGITAGYVQVVPRGTG